jgi:hypothetical protein
MVYQCPLSPLLSSPRPLNPLSLTLTLTLSLSLSHCTPNEKRPLKEEEVLKKEKKKKRSKKPQIQKVGLLTTVRWS